MQQTRSSLFLVVVLALTFFQRLPLVFADVADVDAGATNGTQTVTSAVAGVRVGPEAIRTGLRVRVHEDAAVPVCFVYADRGASCATALTNPDNASYCASAEGGYVFLVHDEHFRGQVCAILRAAGSSGLGYNAW